MLARAVDVLETEATGGAILANDVVAAIGKLYACELSDATALLQYLREVSGTLSALLTKLHDPAASVVADDAGALAAKSLAILYPVRTALERAFAESAGVEATLDAFRAAAPAHFTDSSATLVDDEPRHARKPSLPAVAERRDQSRVSLEVDIGLHSATQFYAGMSGDISEGGLFISSARLFPIGTDMTVSFVLPSGIAIATLGTVAWHAPSSDAHTLPGMGVRFSRLDELDREAIDVFLARRPALRVNGG